MKQLCKCMSPRNMGYLDTSMEDKCGNCGKDIYPEKLPPTIEDLFCEDYAKLEDCSYIEVMEMLKKKDRIFLRMFEIYKAGMKRSSS